MLNYDYGPDCNYSDSSTKISFIAKTGERLTTPKMVYDYLSKRIYKQEAAIKAASLFLFKHVNCFGNTRVSEKNTIYIQNGTNETINITPFTDAIIYYCPYRLLLECYFSKFITQKVELVRGSQIFDLIDKKAVWAGDYIIFICPDEDAVFYNHCFVCTIKDDKLYCSQPPCNVNDFKSAGEVRKKYDYFKDRFNKALSLYSSHSNLNYFEGIND